MDTTQVLSNEVLYGGSDLFGAMPTQILPPVLEPEKPKQTSPPQIIEVRPTPKAIPVQKHIGIEESEEDESVDIDLSGESCQPGESTDTFLAKRMLLRMTSDLNGNAVNAKPDLFGHIEGDRELRRLDALIWMFNLNPDGSDVPFDWVCNELGYDANALRNITSRSVRQDMKRILKLLSSMVSPAYAKHCEYELSEYLNLTGWENS